MTVKSKIAAVFGTVVLIAAGFEVHRLLSWYTEARTEVRQGEAYVEETLDFRYLGNMVTELDLLTSGAMRFSAYMERERGTVPKLTHEKVRMYYSATAYAAVDAAKAEVKVNDFDKTVTVYLPKPFVLSVKVAPSSVRYERIEKALFSNDSRETGIDEICIAEGDAWQNLDRDELFARSEKSAAETVKQLVQPICRDYVVNVVFDKGGE